MASLSTQSSREILFLTAFAIGGTIVIMSSLLLLIEVVVANYKDWFISLLFASCTLGLGFSTLVSLTYEDLGFN